MEGHSLSIIERMQTLDLVTAAAAVFLTQLPAAIGVAVAILHPDASRRADARLALRALRSLRGVRR